MGDDDDDNSDQEWIDKMHTNEDETWRCGVRARARVRGCDQGFMVRLGVRV
jgi:hypothetical protein